MIGAALAVVALDIRAAPVELAIISDGDSQLSRETKAALIEELEGLSDFDLTFHFPEGWQRSHGWRLEDARQDLEAALAEGSIDVVVALDILSSSIASGFSPEKPLIATTVVHPELQSFSMTDSGASATTNLHFLTAQFDLAGALRDFRRHTAARHIALLVDGSVFSAIPSLANLTSQAESELDFELSLLEVQPGEVEGWLDEIPSTVDALFLAPLPQLSRSQLDQLIRYAKKRRWPTFTTLGRTDVEAGFLMGQNLVVPPEQLARRLAVDIRDIALGRSTTDLSVLMEIRDRLSFNRLTAEAIGFEPSFELLFDADIVNEEILHGPVLSLRGAVDLALERNLLLAISKADLEVSREDIQVARSALRPQLSGDASWTRQDRDLVGMGPTRAAELGLSLSQSIYSESLRSNHRAAQLIEEAVAADLDATELDVIESAALAYLRLLVAKTERDIRIENLILTRANLDRARFRYDVGSTDRSEVLRFEAALGSDSQNVTRAVAAFERQRFELNRVLRQPIGLPVQTMEAGIATPKIFNDSRLARFLDGPEGLETLGSFLSEEAVRNAPELDALEARIAAQDRLLLASKRRRHRPSLQAFSRASRIVDHGGALTGPDFDEDWSIGVELSWSLFEGGGIQAKTRRAALSVQRLELAREQAADFIKAETRGHVAAAAASRLNISFAESSAEAARRTLDLVIDAYERGTASYIDLIDAQNTFLNARLAAANANYQHLQDLVELQRSVAYFDFLVSSEHKEGWLDRLVRFSQLREDR